MSSKIRYCLLCQRHDSRTNRRNYTRICTVEREEKLREGYRRRYNGQEIDQTLSNQLVHQKCYKKTVQYIPSVDQPNSPEDLVIPNEQNHDEEHDQEAVIQSRSPAVVPYNPKSVQERSQRTCVICHSYAYSYTNRMKLIASSVTANKLAQGFLHRYKRLYGKSFLDAYMHDACYRKLYSGYRSQPSERLFNRTPSPYYQQMASQSKISPPETRNHSNVNRSPRTTNESANASVEDLLTTPIALSVATANPNIELSARSCLFRPCLKRLSPDEIELYTKRTSALREIHGGDFSISHQVPITRTTVIQPLTSNDRTIYTNQNNDTDTNEEDLSILYSTSVPQPKISATAEIRYRSSKLNDSLPIVHDDVPNIQSQRFRDHHLDELYDWLIEQLKSSENPLSMSEVVQKYNELTADEIKTIKRDRICRIRLRNRLEKCYPNEFVFVVPSKHDGTFIALNDIDHYLRYAIKKAQADKEKATKASMVSSVIAPLAARDCKRETCEAVMDGIRKIRLYIRDPKQTDCTPPLLMQNVVGLITASKRQFEKISDDYDFYHMTDENVFDYTQEKPSSKLDKSARNMSLASDLISVRHERQVSQKHYLLAAEIAKDTFHCTPRQVITLLNQYGHTCSYRSYQRMKASIEQPAKPFGEVVLVDENESSDLELDLMDL